MKVLLILISGLIWIPAVCQPTNLTAEQDSVRRIREEKMMEFRRQREIYERMYAENPRTAVEWKIDQRINELSGRSRLENYQKNQRIDTLREIDLTSAGLTEVPDFVLKAKNLEILVLDDNQIKKLPKELEKLEKLKRIYWRGNKLDNVWWIRIPQINDLERFDISDNLLSRMPLGVRKLEGLSELVAEENFFGEVPVSRLKKASFIRILSMNKSHDLSLGENQYQQLGFLKVFKANKCQLNAIDASLYKLAGLNELQLQENELKAIPEGISQMSNLTKLSFYKNELQTLPPDLFDLNLKVIDLYYNELEVISPEIGNLKDLEILFLAHNKIYSIPETLGDLKKLDELYLHHNRLSVLPPSLSDLKKLRVVRVNDNYLVDFPTQFLGIQSLEDFDISNNQITTIPERLADQKNLHLFTYQENPMDFNSRENAHLAKMIYQMSEEGVICVPRVYQEMVQE